MHHLLEQAKIQLDPRLGVSPEYINVILLTELFFSEHIRFCFRFRVLLLSVFIFWVRAVDESGLRQLLSAR